MLAESIVKFQQWTVLCIPYSELNEIRERIFLNILRVITTFWLIGTTLSEIGKKKTKIVNSNKTQYQWKMEFCGLDDDAHHTHNGQHKGILSAIIHFK